MARTERSIEWLSEPSFPGVSKLGVSMIGVGLLFALLGYATDQAWSWADEQFPSVIVLIGMILTLTGVVAFGAIDATRHDRVRFVMWSSILAAGLSIEAGLIHFAVVGEHLAEYVPFGALFAALAAFQVLWALLYLARPRPFLAIAAIAVNGGAIIVWALSRTVGLPIGPEPWAPETLGPLDVLASATETALVGLLTISVLPAARRLRCDVRIASAVAFVGSVLLIGAVLTVAAFRSDGGLGGHHTAAATRADLELAFSLPLTSAEARRI